MPTKKDIQAELEEVQEFINPDMNIIEAIEKLVLEEDITVLDALIHISESRGIELELLGSLVKKSSSLKKLLTEECRQLHCLK